jgi:hypothetical protein
MERVLRWRGFDEFRVLQDYEASAQNILDGCRWLQEGTKYNGPLNGPDRPRRAFTYSGHGSTLNGAPCIIPADTKADWSNVLTFHQLGEALAFPETTIANVFLDCCHSGARLRDLQPPSEEFRAPLPRPRFLPPPEHLQVGCEMSPCGTQIYPHPRSMYRLTANCDVVITGCRVNQTSSDAYISHSFHGAMTWYLTRVLEDTQGKVTYSDLVSRMTRLLHANGYDQTPMYEGPPEYSGVHFLEAPFIRADDGVPDAQPSGPHS